MITFEGHYQIYYDITWKNNTFRNVNCIVNVYRVRVLEVMHFLYHYWLRIKQKINTTNFLGRDAIIIYKSMHPWSYPKNTSAVESLIIQGLLDIEGKEKSLTTF